MTFGRRLVGSPSAPAGNASPLPPHETALLSVVGTPKALPTEEQLIPIVRSRIPPEEVRTLTRGQLAGKILEIVRELEPKDANEIDPFAERQLVTALIEDSLATAQPAPVLPLFSNVSETNFGPTDVPQLSRVEAAKD